MKEDFKERDFLRRIEVAGRELRAEKGFAGIDGPLSSIQKQMLADFKQSASIKHPGQKGNARENLLRAFLKGNYLPQRYGITDNPSFVVATNGMLSQEMDIVIYDALDTPRLFDVGGVQYFPVEAVYGVIQVKSDLNSTSTINEGLGNLASFKSLKYANGSPPNGFGLLFSYDATLKWSTVFETVKSWELQHSAAVWPNMVAILNQGLILNHDGRRAVLPNVGIAKLQEPQLMAAIGDDAALVSFYLLLMDLLGATDLPRVPMRQYVSLPSRSGTHSVRFGHGSTAEVRSCSQHGEYLRELREGAADQIVAACEGGDVDAGGLMDAAYGSDNKGNWGTVRLFNPEALSADEALIFSSTVRMPGRDPITTKAFGFEELYIDEVRYWIPHYYAAKLSLISGCPKCSPRDEDLSEMTIKQWHALWDARAKHEMGEEIDESEASDR